MVHKCYVCGIELNTENCYPSSLKKYQYICKKCECERTRQWRKANPDKAKASYMCSRRKRGVLPFDKNKDCGQFLGIHVAERVLSHVFKNVKRMPLHHKFDFLCSKGKKIDVKSACPPGNRKGWQFHIRRNASADYFLCLAFNDRKNLDPLYAWLIPGDKVNHLMTASISPTTIHKWDSYQIDISKVVACCNVLKEA